jgi:hypothetical protein
LCYRQLTKHSSTLCNLWIQQYASSLSLSLSSRFFVLLASFFLLRSSFFVLRSSCFAFSCFITNFRFVKVCEKEKGAEVVRQVKKTLPQRLVPFPAARTTAHTTAHAARQGTDVVLIWRYGP